MARIDNLPSLKDALKAPRSPVEEDADKTRDQIVNGQAGFGQQCAANAALAFMIRNQYIG